MLILINFKIVNKHERKYDNTMNSDLSVEVIYFRANRMVCDEILQKIKVEKKQLVVRSHVLLQLDLHLYYIAELSHLLIFAKCYQVVKM